jgi:hypothetical protein
LLFAQPALDAALAIAEAPAYLGFHLKYLPARGEGCFVTTLFPANAEVFQVFSCARASEARGTRLFRA